MSHLLVVMVMLIQIPGEVPSEVSLPLARSRDTLSVVSQYYLISTSCYGYRN